MESLAKQIRVRFSGVEQEKTEESGSVHDRRIPLQKTQSFKEKRKTQNWFQRQLSGKMSQDYDSDNPIEHATAVAAAAFAIWSIEESAISDQTKTGHDPKPSLVRIKSKREETVISKPEPGRISKIFSGAGSKKSTPEQEDPDGMVVPISTATTGKSPEKAILPVPSIKKTPTFADKQLNSTGSMKPETSAPQPLRPPSIKKTPTFTDKHLTSTGNIKAENAAPKPNLSTTMRPTGPSNETTRQTATGPGIRKTQADIWEEAEIGRLKERYEKQNATILSWENNKKKKSRDRLDTIESEIEGKRAKALKKFNSEMEYIKQVAEGARAKAEERHRNELLKVKEKANTMRRTGKAPTTCFCF